MVSGNYTYTTVAAATGDEAGIAATHGLRLMGWSVRETAAGVATLNIQHGAASATPIMAAINLAAAGSASEWYGPQGLPCSGGVWIERLTGTTQVNLITMLST